VFDERTVGIKVTKIAYRTDFLGEEFMNINAEVIDSGLHYFEFFLINILLSNPDA
jgi:hypothetical protein